MVAGGFLAGEKDFYCRGSLLVDARCISATGQKGHLFEKNHDTETSETQNLYVPLKSDVCYFESFILKFRRSMGGFLEISRTLSSKALGRAGWVAATSRC